MQEPARPAITPAYFLENIGNLAVLEQIFYTVQANPKIRDSWLKGSDNARDKLLLPIMYVLFTNNVRSISGSNLLNAVKAFNQIRQDFEANRSNPEFSNYGKLLRYSWIVGHEKSKEVPEKIRAAIKVEVCSKLLRREYALPRNLWESDKDERYYFSESNLKGFNLDGLKLSKLFLRDANIVDVSLKTVVLDKPISELIEQLEGAVFWESKTDPSVKCRLNSKPEKAFQSIGDYFFASAVEFVKKANFDVLKEFFPDIPEMSKNYLFLKSRLWEATLLAAVHRVLSDSATAVNNKIAKIFGLLNMQYEPHLYKTVPSKEIKELLMHFLKQLPADTVLSKKAIGSLNKIFESDDDFRKEYDAFGWGRVASFALVN